MIKFFIIMLLIIPWIFLPMGNVNDQFRLPQACAMDIMFLGLIAMSFCKGNSLIYRNKYLSWLVGYLFLNFFIYFFLPFSISYTKQGRSLNISMMEPMIHIFLGLWAVQIMLSNFERDDFFRIAKALCVSSVAIACFCVLQLTGFDPLRIVGAKYMLNAVSACLDNPNLVGMYLVLCLPLFLIFKELKYKIGFLIVLLGIGISGCHFAWGLAALTLGLYTLLRFKNKWVWLGLLLSAILGIFIIYHFNLLKLNTNMSGRLPIWAIAIDKFKANPLFGQGLGVWKTFQVMTGTTNYTYWYFVHNDWLERLVELGIVGVSLISLVIINSLKRFSYEVENLPFLCMFITFLVMMIGSFPWEVTTIATLGIISFCAVEKL